MWIKDIRDYILYEDKDILVCHKPLSLIHIYVVMASVPQLISLKARALVQMPSH